MEKLQEITIDEVVYRYTVLLLDAYGVLVHTSGAIPGDILSLTGQSNLPIRNDVVVFRRLFDFLLFYSLKR